MPAGTVKTQALIGLINRMAENDPEGALALVQSSHSRRIEGSVYNIFSQWARRDPASAAERASRLPPGVLPWRD